MGLVSYEYFGGITEANTTTFECTYSYVQRQRCCRLERFFNEDEHILVFKTH
jgi:hypothetical protein